MFEYLNKFYFNETLNLFEEDPLLELPKEILTAVDGASEHLPKDFLPKLRAALRGLECDAFRRGSQFGGQLMLELMEIGVPNIVCIQPFGCLPNHVVGKGVIKKLRSENPKANIVAIDYDPGASEVNQLNRIKLMLSTAQRNLNKK